MHRHHASNFTRPRQQPLDASDRAPEQLGFDDARGQSGWERDEREDELRAAHGSAERLERVEPDLPRTPRSYQPETGLSYDQYQRSRYYDGYVEGQLKASATPFRYRHGEYTLGGEPTASRAAAESSEVTVRTIELSDDDESLRAACEREATQQWPGARVFVDAIGERYRAAVYLPEDGLQPDASAQQSTPSESARVALEELLRALRSQPTLHSH